jgi:hypothetical protein
MEKFHKIGMYSRIPFSIDFFLPGSIAKTETLFDRNEASKDLLIYFFSMQHYDHIKGG